MKSNLIILIALLANLTISFAYAAININTADKESLIQELKGIGNKKAEAIIQYREEHGDFKALEELRQITGIGPKFIADNKDNIQFSDTPG